MRLFRKLRNFIFRQMTRFVWHKGDVVHNRYNSSKVLLLNNTKEIWTRWDEEAETAECDQYVWEATDESGDKVKVAVGYHWR